MVVVTSALPALSGELALFHTTDPLLSNSPVLVFYGPAASISATTSRIQVHVYTPAGLESYTRLAISPNSPYYAAVSALPREEQGDEVCRGLAFGLAKYFAEIARPARDAWVAQACTKKAPSAFALFTDAHVAILATRMNRVENAEEVIDDIQRSLGEQSVSWLDLDVVLPPNAIQSAKLSDEQAEAEGDGEGVDEEVLCARRYGQYASFIKMLGEPAFLPTSKLKRAPSKPTAIGRSQAFLRDQREMARKEMCELVDTEANYVSKLDSLVNGVAGDMRSTAVNPAIPVTSMVERMIHELFPSTLDDMLGLNSAFLNAVQQVLDSTEDAAMADVEDNAEETSYTTITDDIGLTDFAKCLIEWFPKFADSYPLYMRANARFPRLLRKINRQADEAILAKLQDVGEKRLTSMLIEPVQRLPRYTLYIDSIAKQLPVAHPALKLLLKARDIISEICSQDAPGMQETDILVRLQRLVGSWPEEIESLGRLITITDACELLPPFEPTDCRGSSGSLLLFTNCTIFLERRGENAMTARALLAELGKPLLDDRRDSSQVNFTPTLHFVEAFALKDTHITEYMNHRAVNLLPTTGPTTSSGVIPEHRVYLLEGAYAGKASKFQEEWTKAQVEGRFSEEERDGAKWEVRSAQGAAGELNLFNAIFEQQPDNDAGATRIRVVIAPERHDRLPNIGENGLEAIISMTELGNGFWQITTEGALAMTTRDKVTEGEFLPILMRRLSGLLQARFSARNPAVVRSMILRNQQIIDDLNLQFQQVDVFDSAVPVAMQDHSHRPRSPVKLLSSLLDSRHQHAGSKKQLPPVTLTDPPQMRPAHYAPNPPSRDSSRPVSRDDLNQRPATAPETGDAPPVVSSTKRLEETMSAYLLALQARKGNIVGKIVQARSRANELSVNELYNSLLEDPNMMVVAAQSSIDVLFAAFEKFLKVAWKEQCGPIISLFALRSIQAKAESLFPVDFERYFKQTFHLMSLQNQRALRGFVKLLADLLDGTGNDGDRGMLTAAFVEILVPEGDPYTFVSLLDRFVDDIESLFGEVVVARDIQALPTPPNKNGSATRHTRSRSVNTASLTSNTSLRKKFGFSTLGRDSNRPEPESKVGSVFRALSKSTRMPEQPSSLSRGTLHRSQTNIEPRALPTRPNSHDYPPALSSDPPELRPRSQDAASVVTQTSSRPRSQDQASIVTQTSSPGGLRSIQEAPTPQSTQVPKKKRRSSLSDLKTLETAIGESPFMSPSTLHRFYPEDQSECSGNSSKLLSPSPSLRKPTAISTPTRIGGLSSQPRSLLPSVFRPENSPAPERAYSTSMRPKSVSANKSSDKVTITPYNHGSLRRSEYSSSISSGIPSLRSPTTPRPLRSGLAERPTAGNAMRVKASPAPEKTLKPSPIGSLSLKSPPPTRKLRMQSPQKLRERLQDEQKAISDTQSSLQDELSKISAEMTALGPGRMGSVRVGSRMTPVPASRPVTAPSSSTPHSNNTLAATADLSSRLRTLESSLPTLFTGFQDRITALGSDISTSLTVSETKAKRLDELYRDANAENEALYSKVNEELARVMRGVRAGGGVGELKGKLKESQEEEGRLRRENARLKREVLGLRSQLRE